LSTLASWLDERTGRAPAALAERARQYALHCEAAGPAASDASPTSTANTLADAAVAALGQVLSQAGDRSAALDLLVGDALITLALLAQAETAPASLGEFARTLLRPERLAGRRLAT